MWWHDACMQLYAMIPVRMVGAVPVPIHVPALPDGQTQHVNQVSYYNSAMHSRHDYVVINDACAPYVWLQ